MEAAKVSIAEIVKLLTQDGQFEVHVCTMHSEAVDKKASMFPCVQVDEVSWLSSEYWALRLRSLGDSGIIFLA